MKFIAALTCLLAVGANAFSPKGFVPNKSGLMVPPSAQDDSTSPLSIPNMVSGGAERSYGQEYYEGELVVPSVWMQCLAQSFTCALLSSARF